MSLKPTLADLMTEYVCTCSPPGERERSPGKGGHAGLPDGGLRCATAAAAAEVARRFYEPKIERLYSYPRDSLDLS